MKKEETIGFMIKTLDKLMMRNHIAMLGECGESQIPVMHGWVIGYLYRNQDREIYQKDLETEFSIARSTVTAIVKQMERKGLIEREGVDRDSRLKSLTLTKKGMEAYENVMRNIQKMEERMAEGIDEEELKIFWKVSARIRTNLCRGLDQEASFDDRESLTRHWNLQK
ncbi:MAG: MarR family transcriptional regulator [Eubacteriales bacterium]|nr:MarR family transcriptional regulator [Eubacteriales bacterium]